MITDADVERLRSICPSSRQPDQLPRVLFPRDHVAPPTAVGRPFRRDRIDFEGALTERERFDGYANAKPWSPDGAA